MQWLNITQQAINRAIKQCKDPWNRKEEKTTNEGNVGCVFGNIAADKTN